MDLLKQEKNSLVVFGIIMAVVFFIFIFILFVMKPVWEQKQEQTIQMQETEDIAAKRKKMMEVLKTDQNETPLSEEELSIKREKIMEALKR